VKCYDLWPGLSKVGRHTVIPSYGCEIIPNARQKENWEPHINLCKKRMVQVCGDHSALCAT